MSRSKRTRNMPSNMPGTTPSATPSAGRSLRARLMTLALSLAAAIGAAAWLVAATDDQQTGQQTRQQKGQATPSTAGQRAFIDPVTGELRQPEHEELAALAAADAAAAPPRRLARTANAAPESFGPDGSIVAVVPEDLHTFSVATRGPDGRIVIEHAQGANDAARLMNANSAKNPQAPVSRMQKEDRNDR
jgi:hypothetical protein